MWLMNKINAEIICDSMSPKGDRITTYVLTYPRFIHSELMTHRVFSRNSASSRAIPFYKMVASVIEDPFIPIAWQKDHSGMQGTEYLPGKENPNSPYWGWINAKESALKAAIQFSESNITKQLCNRLLEPFLWHKVLVTATEFSGFFELRCPKYAVNTEPDVFYKSRKELEKVHTLPYELNEWEWWNLSHSGAEIHIQALAEAMYDAMIESTPKSLKLGEWHMPFGDRINLEDFIRENIPSGTTIWHGSLENELKLKVATARCARTSYNNFDGKIDYHKDIQLHDNLLENKHMSPFEHCAQVPTISNYNLGVGSGFTHSDSKGHLWSGNFKGWIQYRQLIQKPL